MVAIDGAGVRSERFAEPRPKGCLFEYVYLARPDTTIAGRSVQATRVEVGRRLAREHPVEADMVIPTPESGTPAAIGYAEASGIPYGQGLVKNSYVGRTFIQPSQTIRQLGIRLKLNPLREAIEGKRLVVVDDSIGADTLGYISLDELISASRIPKDNLCRACFDGIYPIELPDPERLGKHLLEGLEQSVRSDADGVQSLLGGAGAEDALRPWSPSGFDPGGTAFMHELAAGIPVSCKYSVRVSNLLVHPETGVVFGVHHGRYTFLLRGDPAPSARRVRASLDGVIDLRALEDAWYLYNDEEDDDATEIRRAFEAAGRP
jgi:hypothetical protein